jgi:hypothetical protein
MAQTVSVVQVAGAAVGAGVTAAVVAAGPVVGAVVGVAAVLEHPATNIAAIAIGTSFESLVILMCSFLLVKP